MSPRPKAGARRRLDAELVAQGFFSSQQDAMRAVLAGEVHTSDRRLERPGEQVRPGVELHVRGRNRFVSRGGLKLEHGLNEFGVDVAGLDCLDIGCSTGGFTDCLLKHGARSVLAVDVGYAQFDWSLRQDERVTLLERTNVVDLPDLPQARAVRLAVCDVSFTSVLTILPAVCRLLEPEGLFLTLVKPQFEASREDVGEGGVIRDERVWNESLAKVASGMRDARFDILGSCTSPILGHKGNREFLMLGCMSARSQD